MSKKQMKPCYACILFVAFSIICLATPLDRWGANFFGHPSDIFLVRICDKISVCVMAITASIYFCLKSFNLLKKASRIMKYITSIFGASFIFICTFILVGFIVGLIFPTSRQSIGNSSFTNIASVVAFILASLAAGHSFRTTMKMYSQKESKRRGQNIRGRAH